MLHDELTSLLSDRYSVSESSRINHARGEDIFDPVLPLAVAFPKTNLEISEIIKICSNHSVPIVPFGTGTSLEGHVLGNENGITISLENMNSILEVNAEDFDCRVEAYVTRKQLNEELILQILLYLTLNILKQQIKWIIQPTGLPSHT